ncbi:MAG: cytochrome P450 [Betaproteobacteria bacterium]|nr:cytochrome P450 [Betaproteobacteria bacterium]
MSALPHAQALAENFDLRDLPADFYTDPYPYYRALREHAPVKRMPDGSYFLTRFADCLFVYKNPKLFSSDKKREFKQKYGDSPLYEHHTTSLVFNDSPLHTRVRRLIAGALTPRASADMQPGLVTLVGQLLDDIAAKKEADLIEDFASRIPIEIIGNLLGVPCTERGPLREWSLAILGALEPTVTPAAFVRGNRAVEEFLVYLEGLIAHRRERSGDPARDVLTRLIQGEISGEMSGERLTEKELLHNCIFLLNAGHETTTNLIGNGLVLLSRHPDQRARLLAQPELIESAVDEILRYESSNQLGNRIATQATGVGAVSMAAGTQITLCIGAANRDPAQFPDPERFDIARAPNRHLAFGAGIHHCVGLNLARLEGEVAISSFLARFPRYELAGESVHGGRARFRGFLHVPCKLAG